MKNLVNRWRSESPKFWAKVNRISLWLSVMLGAGGIADYLEAIPDSALIYPEKIRMITKTLFTISVVATVISKLTKQDEK